MGKDSKNCKQPSYQLLKDQVNNRVDNIQSMMDEIQGAKDEGRAGDVAKLVEQVNLMLREWKDDLEKPTPQSSLHEDSLGSFSRELNQLLQQYDVEDDATSPLTVPPIMKHGDATRACEVPDSVDVEVCYMNQQQNFQGFQIYRPQQHEFKGFQSQTSQHEFSDFDNYTPQHEVPGFQSHTLEAQDCQGFEHCSSAATNMRGSMFDNFEPSDLHNMVPNNSNMTTQLDYLLLDEHQNLDSEIFISANGIEHWGMDDSGFSGELPNVIPPPSAFLAPKCALWDCTRPAELCKIYCSTYHATLAVNESLPGTPILRPGGIGLKDDPLFVALMSKLGGKDVGIPECIGAASSRSPWNSPELFNISFFEGEKIREWLFFDKPQRAFETGNRKQRSLPDYPGRWHESRKLHAKEYDCQKRSYYADPQPQKDVVEWHLFEYEKIAKDSSWALYRLERKVVEEKKKSPKTKVSNDPLVDLQKKMDKLSAEPSTENKLSGKGKAKVNAR